MSMGSLHIVIVITKLNAVFARGVTSDDGVLSRKKITITVQAFKRRSMRTQRIDPRGLGTQLLSAASPNQVIKINAYKL